MITDLIVWVFSGLVAFLVGLIPGWALPDWLGTVVTTLGAAIGHITMLSGWVPVKAIGTVVAFMLACTVLAFGIRIGRIVLSVSTGGGGSAA